MDNNSDCKQTIGKGNSMGHAGVMVNMIGYSVKPIYSLAKERKLAVLKPAYKQW